MRLHQLIVAGLATASIGGTVVAQGTTGQRSRFGIAGGFNSSTIGGTDFTDASRRNGFIAGVLLVFPVASNVAIQPELLYTSKGVTGNDTDFNAALKMNYIEVPVLVRVDVPTSGRVRPFLYAGPAVSFKASCNIEVSGQGVNINSNCDDFESSGTKMKTVDYGLVGGGGLAFDVGGRTFSIGARYDHSLGKIVDESDSKHRVISVLATLEFPWGK
jgi:hypothetical protein